MHVCNGSDLCSDPNVCVAWDDLPILWISKLLELYLQLAIICHVTNWSAVGMGETIFDFDLTIKANFANIDTTDTSIKYRNIL